MLSNEIARFVPYFSVMTFNVRYDNPGDGLNAWEHRKKDVVKFIQQVKPHMFGLQEPLRHQLCDFKEKLPDYDFIGVGRNDGAGKGEYNPIFYNRNVFTLLESGTFWLSATPNEVGSRFDDVRLRRICTWGKFKWLSHETEAKKEFYLLNTHLDHESGAARRKQINVIFEFIEKNVPQCVSMILMGDFNAENETDEIMKTLASGDIFQEASVTADVKVTGRTFTGFGGKREEVLDHLFYRGFHVSFYAVLKDKRENGKLLSDHRPVFCFVKPE